MFTQVTLLGDEHDIPCFVRNTKNIVLNVNHVYNIYEFVLIKTWKL